MDKIVDKYILFYCSVAKVLDWISIQISSY